MYVNISMNNYVYIQIIATYMNIGGNNFFFLVSTIWNVATYIGTHGNECCHAYQCKWQHL